MGKKLKVKKSNPSIKTQSRKDPNPPVSGVATTAPATSAGNATPIDSEKLSALSQLAVEAETVDSSQRRFMEPQSTVKKKRGRPTNQSTPVGDAP